VTYQLLSKNSSL